MNTDQARRVITLHDNADRALANLRNAGAMSIDDPRATEMLESAGDAYAEATTALAEGDWEAIQHRDEALRGGEMTVVPSGDPEKAANVSEASRPPAQPSGSAPGAEDSQLGGGQVQPEAGRGTPAEDSGQGDTPEDA